MTAEVSDASAPGAASDEPEARCALGVFLRVPARGRVKTRLAARLGPDAALALYEAFVADTLALSDACEPRLETTLWLDAASDGAAAPDVLEPPAVLAALVGPRRLAVQPPGPLGARMAHALGTELARAPRALLIGSDSPSLPAAHLALAMRALEQAPLVLGPAVDGGFYLLGARAELAPLLPELLRSPRWSTAHALADTCVAARALGLETRLLPPWFDVDDPVGLGLLRLQLSRAPAAAPASARCLAGLARDGLLTWPVGS